MEECIINIKSRHSKKHWKITIEEEVAEEEVAEEEVAEEEVAEVSNTIETDDSSDWELVVESFKTTIKIRRPTPAGARAIADKLNQLPIKGITSWTPNQAGTVISILGTPGKEEDLKEIIQPLFINIIVEHRGDEK